MGLPKKTGESFGANVLIRLPKGDTFSVVMHPCDALRKIYDLVASRERVPVDLIRIKYTGKTLKPSQTSQALGLIDDIILKAEVITESDVALEVHVDYMNSNVKVNVKNTSKLDDILRALKANGVERNCQLFVGSKQIPPNEVLHDLKIFNNSALVAKEVVRGESSSEKHKKMEKKEQEAANDSEIDAALDFNTDGRPVEVVFSFDTTGSMYGILEQVRTSLKTLIEKLTQSIPGIRIGLIAHGDYCDYSNYVVKVHELSNDAQSLTGFAMGVPSTGGGDSPECYELVLKTAKEFDWSLDSAKALIVIGDDVPHPPSMTDQDIYWHSELDVLCGMGVKVYGVQAKGNDISKHFYKELADRSNGAYISFTNFSLISDMFLAVCYNEASDEQLEHFEQSLNTDGNLCSQKAAIFKQLKEQQIAVKEDKAAEIRSKQIAFDPRQSSNYIKQSWFDRACDHGTPAYSYNANTNKWKLYEASDKSRKTGCTSDVPYVPPVSHVKKRKPRLLSCFG